MGRRPGTGAEGTGTSESWGGGQLRAFRGGGAERGAQGRQTTEGRFQGENANTEPPSLGAEGRLTCVKRSQDAYSDHGACGKMQRCLGGIPHQALCVSLAWTLAADSLDEIGFWMSTAGSPGAS